MYCRLRRRSQGYGSIALIKRKHRPALVLLETPRNLEIRCAQFKICQLRPNGIDQDTAYYHAVVTPEGTLMKHFALNNSMNFRVKDVVDATLGGKWNGDFTYGIQIPRHGYYKAIILHVPPGGKPSIFRQSDLHQKLGQAIHFHRLFGSYRSLDIHHLYKVIIGPGSRLFTAKGKRLKGTLRAVMDKLDREIRSKRRKLFA